MRPFHSQRCIGAIVAAVTIVAAVAIAGCGSAERPVVVTVRPNAVVRTIPPGFLGLSLEYSAIEAYVGNDPRSVNPVFEALVRSLTPGQAPVLRIGGDSTDWTWWPVAGVARPPGVTYTLTPSWLRVTRVLTRALRARLIMGLNLEADQPRLVSAQARALIDGLGAGAIEAFELGNEPELYRKFPWYRTAAGALVKGRPMSYGFGAYTRDFTRLSAAVPALPLAGPTLGGAGWMPYLGGYLAAEPRVRIVTVHEYPLQLCFVHSDSPHYATVDHLLSPLASAGLADSFRAVVATAHAHGLPVRIDELNTVSCGADPGVSQTFASALWALDTLFEMARVGVDGVNMHTFPGAGYDLFRFDAHSGHWEGHVSPEYYGLQMFAQAVPPGAQLLSVGAPAGGALKLWATRGPGGTVRVVLINKALSGIRHVLVRIPGGGPTAALERLQAPSARASSGVTLGGRSFGAETSTGTLPAPRTIRVSRRRGAYRVTLPAASAALLTL